VVRPSAASPIIIRFQNPNEMIHKQYCAIHQAYFQALGRGFDP
jgi:hypothetical protein